MLECVMRHVERIEELKVRYERRNCGEGVIGAKDLDWGKTLEDAIEYNDISVLKYLIDHRYANLNRFKNGKNIYIYMASEYGRDEMRELLIRSGAQLHGIDEYSYFKRAGERLRE